MLRFSRLVYTTSGQETEWVNPFLQPPNPHGAVGAATFTGFPSRPWRFVVCIAGVTVHFRCWKQEAQLMLTNSRDAFRSQSPNMVLFDMLGMVFY